MASSDGMAVFRAEGDFSFGSKRHDAVIHVFFFI